MNREQILRMKRTLHRSVIQLNPTLAKLDEIAETPGLRFHHVLERIRVTLVSYPGILITMESIEEDITKDAPPTEYELVSLDIPTYPMYSIPDALMARLKAGTIFHVGMNTNISMQSDEEEDDQENCYECPAKDICPNYKED
jgi:hypothetical protein